MNVALNNNDSNSNIIIIIYRLARRYYLKLPKSNNSRPTQLCKIFKLTQ